MIIATTLLLIACLFIYFIIGLLVFLIGMIYSLPNIDNMDEEERDVYLKDYLLVVVIFWPIALWLLVLK